MTDLSVLIPSRNEMFLKRTIDDILSNIEADTEVIAVLDGAWADPVLEDHPRVTLIHHTGAIGQRAAVNEAARLSSAKYVMKADAHCSFDKGFDVKLMKDYKEGETVIPRMYNLHAFDWVCECGERVYQGPRPQHCGKDMNRELVWKPRMNRRTDYALFDKELHFQYWRQHPKGDETMCFVGACFFMSKDRYFELDGLDEKHGSWGQMGVEIACKTWLSGGKLAVNKSTWFAHLFRTQPGFGFPYHLTEWEQGKAKEYSRWLWNLESPGQLPHWEKATRPLKWILDKFEPVPTWH